MEMREQRDQVFTACQRLMMSGTLPSLETVKLATGDGQYVVKYYKMWCRVREVKIKVLRFFGGKPDMAAMWWCMPNPDLNGLTPEQYPIDRLEKKLELALAYKGESK